MPKVLLSKPQIALADFTDEDRAGLRYVHVTDAFAEASEGHLAVKVPHDPALGFDEYPALPDEMSQEGAAEYLIDGNLLAKASKSLPKKLSRTPVLNNVAVSTNHKGLALFTTDLESKTLLHQEKTEEPYPDVENIWKQQPKHRRVTLDARLVQKIVDFACEHGQKKRDIPLRFFISDDEHPVYMEMRLENFTWAKAVIMPLRDPADSTDTETIRKNEEYRRIFEQMRRLNPYKQQQETT